MGIGQKLRPYGRRCKISHISGSAIPLRYFSTEQCTRARALQGCGILHCLQSLANIDNEANIDLIADYKNRGEALVNYAEKLNTRMQHL